MDEKKYPPAVTVKKWLLVAAVLIFVGIFVVIVHNVDSVTAVNPDTKKEESVVKTTANSTDTQWFQNKPANHSAKAPPPLSVTSLPHKVSVVSMPPTTPVLPVQSAENAEKAHRLEAERKALEEAMKAPMKSNWLSPSQLGHQGSSQSGQSSAQSPASSSDDPNHQAEKKAFLNEKESSMFSAAVLQNPQTPYFLKAGTVIPGVMIGGINSDLPGILTGQVKQNVYDTPSGRYLLIPQGSTLFGRYDSQVSYGQERVLVVWQQITFPNGQVLDLGGMPGADMSGYAGFSDQVDNHYGKIFGSVILMSVMTSAAQLSQPDTDNTNTNPNVSQTVAASVGSDMAATMNQMTRKNLGIQPTIKIRPGYEFVITVTSNLSFEKPYQGDNEVG